MKPHTPRKCFVLSAAGTGGHVIPALSIAKALRERGHHVEWIGGQRLEAKLVPQAGITLHQIQQTGLRKRGLKNWLYFPFSFVRSIRAAYCMLKRISPNCVIGMGGYVSAPVGIAAKLLRIPLVIHEQNAIPGLSNQLLRPLAHQCFTGFPQTFKQATVRTIGNPVREELHQIPPYRGPGTTFNILIFGGSLGAQALNKILPQALTQIPSTGYLSIVHQTGEATYEQAKIAYHDCPHPVRLETFIYNMASSYATADLIIARAGALTVSEIATAGRAAIFIPYPHAVDDHQTANATHLVNHQAAFCIQEKDLSPEYLAQQILYLMKHPQRLVEMAQKAREKSHHLALSTFVDYLEHSFQKLS